MDSSGRLVREYASTQPAGCSQVLCSDEGMERYGAGIVTGMSQESAPCILQRDRCALGVAEVMMRAWPGQESIGVDTTVADAPVGDA